MPRFSRSRLAVSLLAAFIAVVSGLLIHSRTDAPAAPPLALSPAPAFAPAPASAPPLEATPAPRFAPSPSTLAPTPAPAAEAFLAWTDRYLAASAIADRDALLAEGLKLARSRRAVLAELIRTDPEAALASALPRALRARLPAALAPELEEIVSARASLEIIQTCLHPPGVAHDHADDLHRATVVSGREYRVHTYGARLHDASLAATSLHGIALDGHIAVAEARHRVLEADEPLPSGLALASADSIAVEAEGLVTVLPSADALPAFVDALLARENNPVLLEADVGQGSSGVSGRPTQAWTHGAKTLLVIRVDFSDLTGTPINRFDGNAQITAAYIDNVINGTSGVRAFFQQGSFGKSDIDFDPATDVTAVLRLPQTASHYAVGGSGDDDSYDSLLHSDARAAATLAGFDVAAYDRVAVVFTNLGTLPGSEITYGGLANVIGANLWINGAFDLRVVAHELGHNHGLRHANLWRPTGGSPVSLTGDNPATPDVDERSVEYGDPFDLMGDGDFSENHFSHWNKSLLQWIPDLAVTTVASSGTYRVYRFDSATADLAAPRALKVVRDTTRDYWIGYRRATASTAADNGAYVLWGYNSNRQGHLLDLTTPGANANDAPLPLNTTFNDTDAGISLRPVAQGGAGADEWLDVQVTLQPRLAWIASSYVVNEQGGSATLSVTRTANATGNVSVAYATAPGTAAATTDYAHTAGTLSWPDGDTSPRTIVVPLVADALVEGTETFTVTLSSPVGGVVVDPAVATVTLADPGARDPAFASDFINSTINRVLVLPDGKLVVAGWFSSLQDTSFNSYGFGRVARLDSTGKIDLDFNPGTGANNTIYALARQPDGKLLIGGDFTSYNGTAINRIARLHPDGSLDASFIPGAAADGTIYDILVQPDGKIVVAGNFVTYNVTARNRLARLNADGTLDASFANPSYSSNGLRALALQDDGKILVAGGLTYTFGSGGGVGFKSGLVRLLANGTRDTTFDVGYGAHTSTANNTTTQVFRIAVLPDGRILVGGAFTGFGNNFTPRRLARVSSTGALDTTFTATADGTVNTLLPLPDGTILIGGNFNTISDTAVARLARLTSAGALDTAFAAAGGHGGSVYDLALQPDGNVVLAGDFASFQSALPEGPLWRLVPGLAGTPGTLQFATDATAAVEGSTATLSVTRTGGSLGALTVGYSTVGDTATAGTDFTATSGTLSWADGDTTAKTIPVPTTLDASADTPETFLVNLGAPLIGGALLGDRQQATITLATAFSAWQATHFSASEIATPTVSGDAADPDGDGLNNLAEFAFGLAPKTADSSAAWTTAIQNISGTDYLTITFRRRAPALDLAYSVQTNDDLSVPAGWSATAVQVGSPIAHGDGTETVTYRDSIATSAATRRFLRVHVTRTP